VRVVLVGLQSDSVSHSVVGSLSYLGTQVSIPGNEMLSKRVRVSCPAAAALSVQF